MTWKETEQKGVFSRAIGENESFIKLVGDAGLPLNREHWAINSSATIIPKGSFQRDDFDFAAHLRYAWGHLRFRHPSLAAEVTTDGANFNYTVPSGKPALDAWISQTFSVSDASSSSAVIPTFQPTPYAKLVYIPQSRELLSHTAHWRTDGIGVLLLLDALLDIASAASLDDPAELAWGAEVVRLAPAVEDAAAMPQNSTSELRDRGAALVGTFGHAAGAVGIPCQGDEATLPGGTRAAALTVSTETTTAIIEACKARGVSVTAAVHASVAGANYALADDAGRQRHYTSTVRFALRPYLPEPYSTPAFAAGLYTTGWMKRVEPVTSWDERLQSYQAEYRKGISREFLDSHREYAAQLGDLIRHMPPGGEPPSDIDISSVGVAERFIRRSYGTAEAGFEVSAVSVGVDILSRQGTMFAWTFREQLNLSAVYNESFHSAQQMARFVSTVKSQLLKGLDVREF